MTRARRMMPVQKVLDQKEKERAGALGAARTRLAAAEKKLKELEQYRQDYEQTFKKRAKAGQSARALRDFQVFLARLEQAIQQQQQLVAANREDVSGRSAHWQSAARQVKALDVVLDRWQGEERLASNRREQKEVDERAQQSVRTRT
jgi:flagellar FliJ protein